MAESKRRDIEMIARLVIDLPLHALRMSMRASLRRGYPLFRKIAKGEIKLVSLLAAKCDL